MCGAWEATGEELEATCMSGAGGGHGYEGASTTLTHMSSGASQ